MEKQITENSTHCVITNDTWKKIFNRFFKWQHPEKSKKNYYEAVGVMYSFSPFGDCVMTSNESMLSDKKVAALYAWYKKGDRKDKAIEKYFDEYKGLIDETHSEYNSNYGYYFYEQGQLNMCASYLANNKNTRHACICINSYSAMQPNSIDKLCTNTIQFFIRRGYLKMIVQMRSSNFLTLLPYDVFTFSMLYWQMFHVLKNQYSVNVMPSQATVFVNSLHFYQKDYDRLFNTEKSAAENKLSSFCADFACGINKMENFLIEQL